MQPRVTWRAAAFAAGHLLVALVCAAALSSYAHFGRRGLLLHMMLIVTAIVCAAAALGVAARAGRRPAMIARSLFAGVGASCAALLGLLYLGSYVGNREWGAGLNYRIVADHLSMAAPDSAPLFIPWSVHLTVLSVVLLLIALYWWAWPTLVTASRACASAARSRWFRSAVAVWLFAGGIVTWSAARAGTLGREPIVGFFFTSDEEFDFTQYSLDRQLPQRALQARASYPRAQAFARRSVIVIIVDALRADHMGVYGYARPTTPFLSGLADAGRLKRVDLALSSCAESACGIQSTMTSKSFRFLSTPAFSVADVLHDQGYPVYQLLSGNHDWNGLKQAYGTEQTLYFDSGSSKTFPVNDDGVVLEGLKHVPDANGQPAFFQVHLMSVHFAGVKHEAFRRYEPWFVRQDFASIINSKRDLVSLVNNYDNGVLEADDTIRRLFEELDRKGYLSNSLVTILADHGEGLGDRDAGPDGLGHVHSLHQEFIHIPLLIYDDAGAVYGNLRFATQVDVAPTILDRLGLPVPASFEGRSLLRPEPRRYSYMQTSRWTPCYALVDRTEAATLKYLRCERGNTEMLYDLNADPMEQSNIIATTDTTVVQGLRDHLQAYLSDATAH